MFNETTTKFHNSIPIDGFYAGCRDIPAMAQYALEKLPEKFALLGHSMGARVALEVYRSVPERVSRLALVDTGIHPVGAHERKKRYALYELGCEKGMRALVEKWLPPMVGSTKRSNVKLMNGLYSMCESAGVETYRDQIDALLTRPIVDDVLANIDCPVHVVVGEDDEWSPVSQHQEIAAKIAGAELRIIPKAGHMAPAEFPQEFNQIVAEWLS